MMYSASLFRESNDGAFRNLIGRANRLLHWDDILFFKNKKYLIYDVGGISIDTTDKEKQAINKFKSCFGGDMVKEYKSFIPLSIKGWIYLILKKTAGRL